MMDFKEEFVIRQIGKISRTVHRDNAKQVRTVNVFSDGMERQRFHSAYEMPQQVHDYDDVVTGQAVQRASRSLAYITTPTPTFVCDLPSPNQLFSKKKSSRSDVRRSARHGVQYHLHDVQKIQTKASICSDECHHSEKVLDPTSSSMTLTSTQTPVSTIPIFNDFNDYSSEEMHENLQEPAGLLTNEQVPEFTIRSPEMFNMMARKPPAAVHIAPTNKLQHPFFLNNYSEE